VNTYTTAAQYAPAVAIDPAGNFVVAWASDDPVSTEIFGQRYASSGAPLGSQFQVNAITTGSQYLPAVAVDPAGNFVVVWAGQGDTDPIGVFGQRFGQILSVELMGFTVK
jgi:hypothetical protein